MLKKWAVGLALLMGILAAAPAWAGDTFVRGYTRRNGTYVAPHYRSAPDEIRSNNWSCCGNTNPYTGKIGRETDIGRLGAETDIGRLETRSAIAPTA